MTRSISSRVLTWTLAALLTAVVTNASWAAGQEEAKDAQPAVAKKVRTVRNRVPNYYGPVVDQKQRERIYKIQRDYASRIEALKAQLTALLKERDEKVAAVLTPEQLKKVEAAKAAAKAKRAQKKRGQKKPAKQEPAAEKPAS